MVHTRAYWVYLLKSIGGATICRILFKTAQSCINFNSVKEQILRIGLNGYQLVLLQLIVILPEFRLFLNLDLLYLYYK